MNAALKGIVNFVIHGLTYLGYGVSTASGVKAFHDCNGYP